MKSEASPYQITKIERLMKKILNKLKKTSLEQVWLYYFIILTLSPVVFILSLFILPLGGDSKSYEMVEEPSIADIYKASRFEGVIDIKFHPLYYGDIQSYEYIYTEGKLEYTFQILYKPSPSLSTYTYEEIVDLYTDQYPDARNGYDQYLFAEFFDQTLLKGNALKNYQQDQKELLEKNGLKAVTVELQYPYYYLDDATKKVFNQEIKKDLKEVNKNGYVPIYGINTLDPIKYWKLSGNPMMITTDSSVDEFVAIIEKMDPGSWHAGMYRLEDHVRKVYSIFKVDENGHWTNITDEEGNV